MDVWRMRLKNSIDALYDLRSREWMHQLVGAK